MTKYEPRWLDEFGIIARTWHRERDSDSANVQDFRQRELTVGHRLLETEMASHVKHRMKIILHIGDQAVSGLRFRRIPYGYTEADFTDIEPGSHIDLTRVVSAQSLEDRRQQPYYGRGVFVNFASIAQTLTQHGRLESAPIDATNDAASEPETVQILS